MLANCEHATIQPRLMLCCCCKPAMFDEKGGIMFVQSLSVCTCAVRATGGDSHEASQTSPSATSTTKKLHEGDEVCARPGKAEEVTTWRCRRRCGAKLISAAAALRKPIWHCLRHPSNARQRRHRSSRKGYKTSPESLEFIVYVH